MPRRLRITLLALAAAVGLVLAAAALTEIRGVGSAEYAVLIESDQALAGAGAEVCNTRDEAEDLARELPLSECRYRLSPTELPRRRLTVIATTTTHEYGLPRRTKHYQQRYLAVVAVLGDGRRVGTAVELPDARESREVTVRLDAPAAP